MDRLGPQASKLADAPKSWDHKVCFLLGPVLTLLWALESSGPYLPKEVTGHLHHLPAPPHSNLLSALGNSPELNQK